LFRAVPIPEGSWRVTLSYHPVSLGTGALISLSGILLCLAYAGYLIMGLQVRDLTPLVLKR
jgi:uncharacterized membrane protein YfhO